MLSRKPTLSESLERHTSHVGMGLNGSMPASGSSSVLIFGYQMALQVGSALDIPISNG